MTPVIDQYHGLSWITKSLLLTAHVGVVDDRFAPHAAAVVLVGADPKLVGRVGFQVVDDCVAGRAGLVDPLPVSLSVADGVKAVEKEKMYV